MAMKIETEIKTLLEGLSKKLTPEQSKVMATSIAEAQKNVTASNSKLEGSKLPEISLKNAHGKTISVQELLKHGPVVVTFYRGAWCPVCNIQLHAMQAILPQLEEQRAKFVAISPQQPDKSLSQVEKDALRFDVLSDTDNKIAKHLGLAYHIDKPMQELYKQLDIDIAAHNGNKGEELPATATFVVRQDGVIAKAFVEADFTKRVEPEAILEALRALPAPSKV